MDSNDYTDRERPLVPFIATGDYHLGTSVGQDWRMSVCLSFTRHRAMYPMSDSELLEFNVMLKTLTPAEQTWNGNDFFAYTRNDEPNEEFNFRRHRDGITFGFSAQEWRSLSAFMDKVLGTPEMIDALAQCDKRRN